MAEKKNNLCTVTRFHFRFTLFKVVEFRFDPCAWAFMRAINIHDWCQLYVARVMLRLALWYKFKFSLFLPSNFRSRCILRSGGNNYVILHTKDLHMKIPSDLFEELNSRFFFLFSFSNYLMWQNSSKKMCQNSSKKWLYLDGGNSITYLYLQCHDL